MWLVVCVNASIWAETLKLLTGGGGMNPPLFSSGHCSASRGVSRVMNYLTCRLPRDKISAVLGQMRCNIIAWPFFKGFHNLSVAVFCQTQKTHGFQNTRPIQKKISVKRYQTPVGHLGGAGPFHCRKQGIAFRLNHQCLGRTGYSFRKNCANFLLRKLQYAHQCRRDKGNNTVESISKAGELNLSVENQEV